MSSLIEEASLIFVPSGYKEDKAYSLKPYDGSGDLTFTRASDGTRVNSQGLVERVPWNLLQQSNTFSTTWGNSNTTETGGQADKDGGNNAWLLTKSASSGYLVQSLTQAGVQTASIYAKASDSDWVYLQAVGTSTASCYFDLINGTTGDTGSLIDKSIELIGNGWYRCSITYNQTLSNFRIYPAEANSLSASSGSVFIQNAQLVEGSTAKPYFPTTDRLNVPRLDYSNGCPSLLLEPQRTNLALYSEDLSNWTNAAGTVNSNNNTSPDGTQNADKFTPTASSANTRTYFSCVSGTTYTMSVFLKAAGIDEVIFDVANSDFSDANVTVNLTSGTITSSGADNISDSIADFGNGWYRVVFTASCTGTNSSSPFIIRNNLGYDGSSGFYVWGAQLEAGSYPTSYIPTTSASVTRVADAAYKTGISSLIGQTEGVIFADITTTEDITTVVPLGISDGTGSNRVLLYIGNGVLNALVTTSGVTQAAITTSSIAANTRYKMAIAYKANDFAFYVNGSLVGTDTSGTVPACSRFNYDNGSGTNPFYGISNQVLLFKTRLTNDQLEYLTGTSYSTYAQMATALNYTIQ